MQGQMQTIKATTAAIKAYTQGDLAWSTRHDLNDLVRKLTAHSPAMFQSAALGPGQSQISTDIAACDRSSTASRRSSPTRPLPARCAHLPARTVDLCAAVSDVANT